MYLRKFLIYSLTFLISFFKIKGEIYQKDAYISYLQKKIEFLKKYYDRYYFHSEELNITQIFRYKNHTYLDYTGSGLYQIKQLNDFYEDLKNNRYGNSHSNNPSAKSTEKKLGASRDTILKFLNTNSNEYSIIFTSGSTGALKMIGEYFPWGQNSLYYYLRINHNSVLGIREYAVEKGGNFKALSENEISKILYERKKLKKNNDVNSPVSCLFAYPPKDNFAGVIYPLDWMEDVKLYGLSDKCHWYVVADTAAYVATHKFDLSKYKYVDFAVISFYKIFGYPTGIGTLIVKNSSAHVFKKVYFGGGSVVTALCDSHICKRHDKDNFAYYEDGTLSFLGINAVLFGLNIFNKISYDIITKHIRALSEYTYSELINIKHSNFTNVARVYHAYNSPFDGIITFNIFDIKQNYINFSLVESIASYNNIHLRGGCFCNSGACQDYLNLNSEEMINSYKDKRSCIESNSNDNKPFGAIRISFGYLSTFRDSFVFIKFIKDNFVK